MERIPEPELMDDAAQALAYARADFSEAHDSCVEHFRSRFPELSAGTVLDLGCGPCDVTMRFARALPEARFVGVDGAAEMLALARADLAERGLDGRVALEQHLLPSTALAGRAFDAVVSNSLLHHLADPAVLWETVRDAAAAGAPVGVMDLMRPDSAGAAEALVALHAADAEPVLRHDFAASLRAAYRPDEVAVQLAEAGLGHFRVEAISDRHLYVWGRLP